MTRDSLRFADIFSGIGGFRVPFQARGGHCVFSAEIDKYARATYQANFNDYADSHMFIWNVRSLLADRVPDHDLLLAGFPCQPFSLAGVSKRNSLGRAHGFQDPTLGTLFHYLKEVIKAKQPDYFVLENVKNLMRHDGGKTFSTICHDLWELGYYVNFRLISSAPWLPQNRERVFIAGTRIGRPLKEIRLDDIEVPEKPWPTLGAILEDEVDDKYTLGEGTWEALKRHKASHKAKGQGFGYSLNTPEDVARTLSARYGKDGSEILIAQDGKRPRKLTPRECSRLMGFDTPQGSDWIIPVSDTQAYRQFGNAIAVPVSAAIAELFG